MTGPPNADRLTPVDPLPLRVQLLGRAGCHLCDIAREIVAAVCAEVGVGWRETDIAAEPALAQRYADYVPVTLVDGEQLDFWHVDPDRLRDALARTRR